MQESLKYPRTFHLPWSPGASKDDKIAKDISSIINVPVVICDKIDGSNACLEKEGVFARTHAHAPTHPSFDWLKSYFFNIKHLLYNDLQLFGENVYAQHTIAYNELPGFFLLFGVRDLQEMKWKSWEIVEIWAQNIGVPTVPVLFKGTFKNEKDLREFTENLMKEPSKCGGEREGLVIRKQDGFKDKDFSHSIFKFVRPNHVQENAEHWSNKIIIKNKLK